MGKLKKAPTTFAELELQIQKLQKSKNDLYLSVKDFGSADALKTDRAIAGMKQYDSEIKSLERQKRKLLSDV